MVTLLALHLSLISRLVKSILVCNYGIGGNLIGSQMYEVGSPCSACPLGTTWYGIKQLYYIHHCAIESLCGLRPTTSIEPQIPYSQAKMCVETMV